MHRACLIPMLSAVLTSIAVQADEPAKDDDTQTVVSSDATAELLDRLGTSTRWQLTAPAPALAWESDFAHPLADIRYEDANLLSRFSRIRRLSLLTLAEIWDAQFYFGVNREGYLGLHLGAPSRRSGDRQLEVARMPYLKDRQTDDDTER